jgi:hypothetical protein
MPTLLGKLPVSTADANRTGSVASTIASAISRAILRFISISPFFAKRQNLCL